MIFVSRPLRIGLSPTGNFYTKEILEKIVEDWKQKDHPLFGTIRADNKSKKSIQYIDLDDVATQIVDMIVDDEGLVIHQRILETPMGNDFLNLLKILDEEQIDSRLNVDNHFSIAPRLYVAKDAENNITRADLICVEITGL